MNGRQFNKCLLAAKTDERAFKTIYDYFLPKIKYRVLSRFGNRVDWQDVSHEFFLRVLKSNGFGEIENPTAWVMRVCDNIALDMLRASPISSEPDENTPSSLSVSAAVEEGDFFKLISLLDEPDRTLVEDVMWYGYSLKECAEKMGQGYAAVRKRYSRAIKKLKAEIKKGGWC